MITLGNIEITKAYLGSTEIDKIYLGEDLVFGGNVPVLPYDSEVEWIGFNYNQYINTGIIPTLSYTFDIKINVTSIRSGNENTNKIFSSRTNSSSNFYELEISNSNSYLRPRYNKNKTLTSYSVPTNTDLIIKLNTDGQYTVNDNVVKTISRVSNSTNKNLYIGCNGSVNTTNGFVGKYYYFKLFNGNTTILDMIPVRVGAVGYMYDKVSGELFGNDGSGDFSLGNDIT